MTCMAVHSTMKVVIIVIADAFGVLVLALLEVPLLGDGGLPQM